MLVLTSRLAPRNPGSWQGAPPSATIAAMQSNAWPYQFVAVPWPDLERFYADLVAQRPEYSYLADIVSSLDNPALSSKLAGLTSMHDLVVTSQPIEAAPIEVVIVRAPDSVTAPALGHVRIEHRSHSGQNDVIERPAAEALPLFWRFMALKFGIERILSGDA